MATKDPLTFDDTDFKLTKLVGAGIAAAMLDDVCAGQPFNLANVARMRGIAAIIIVGSVALFFVGGLVNAYLLNHAIADSATFFANDSSVADLLLPGAGFLIAALAEAFKRGVQLEADVDGLV